MAIWLRISHTGGHEDGDADSAPKIFIRRSDLGVAGSGNARREPRCAGGKLLDSAPDCPNSQPRVLTMTSEREIRDTASATLASRKKSLLERSI
jgi:hypothetical protein